MPGPMGGPGAEPFSVGNAYSYGWKKFTENIGPILLAMLVFFGIYILLVVAMFAIQAPFAESSSVTTDSGFTYNFVSTGGSVAAVLMGIVANIVYFVWGYFLQAAVTRAGLIVTSGRKVEVGHLLTFEKVGTIIVAGIVLSIGVAIGLILCILPGLIIAFFGSYFVFFVLDQNMGAIDSLKASFSFVKDNLGPVILVFLLGIVVTFIGALLCGVGLLAAIPVVVIAQTYTYKKLTGQQVAP